jgi:hypothetical protein
MNPALHRRVGRTIFASASTPESLLERRDGCIAAAF